MRAATFRDWLTYNGLVIALCFFAIDAMSAILDAVIGAPTPMQLLVDLVGMLVDGIAIRSLLLVLRAFAAFPTLTRRSP